MELIDATLEEVEKNRFLDLKFDDKVVRIPLSENKPLDIKAAFNDLIFKLKAGPFQIEFKQEGTDLFFHVAKEYVSQLNGELSALRGEMEAEGLTDEEEGVEA